MHGWPMDTLWFWTSAARWIDVHRAPAGRVGIAAAKVVRPPGRASELLGSPIAIDAIVRVEGFVDSTNGDLHGWAWCPHAPGRDPGLVDRASGWKWGGVGITVVANGHAVGIQHDRPLAIPRGFRIPPDQLRRFHGPVRVQRGAELLTISTGSPLDPVRRATQRGKSHTNYRRSEFPAPGHRAPAAPRDLSILSRCRRM